jgi:hypothetical protein
LTNEATTKPHQNLYTFSDSPVTGIARLSITTKTPSFVADHGKHDREDARSTTSRCTFQTANADDSDMPHFEADITLAAPNTKETGSSEPNAFTSSKDSQALVIGLETDASKNATNDAANEETLEFEKARRMIYTTLSREMDHHLKRMISIAEGSSSDSKLTEISKRAKRCRVLQRVWVDKYLVATKKKMPRKWAPQGPHPKTLEAVNARLRGEWETLHPWIITKTSQPELPPGGLLMRVEDSKSMARIYAEHGIVSQGSQLDLSTFKTRQYAIKNHLDWRNREPTVFISTTDDAADFRSDRIDHMLKRDAKSSECSVKLIFINGNARHAEGWLTLKATKAMQQYNVGTPGNRMAEWYLHEYILLFRVPPSQIVATYCWPVVVKYMSDNKCSYLDWHNQVVVPAFKEHEAARNEGRSVRGKAGCVCCGH